MSYHYQGDSGMGGIADIIRNMFGGGASQGAQAGAGMKPTRATASQGMKTDGQSMASMYAGGTQRPASGGMAAKAARTGGGLIASVYGPQGPATASDASGGTPFQQEYRKKVVPHLKEIQRHLSILLD